MTRISVMVVDDQIEVVQALEALVTGTPSLELVGSATDVEGALALAIERRPDVALIDYKMPRGGGSRLAADLMIHCPMTKIVVLSAHDDRPAVLEMMRAGVSAYLVKGADISEIVAAITRAAG